jgi:hypothetical protein
MQPIFLQKFSSRICREAVIVASNDSNTSVFFWPTIFTALSDPPAALFLLSAIWLLGLSYFMPRKSKIAALAIGGFCIGISAWIRAFYLYPLLFGVLAGCLVSLFNFRKNASCFLLLLALIMPGIQLSNTYHHSSNISYIDKKLTDFWNDEHLSSPYIGYDTLFPMKSNFYSSQYCEVRAGLLDSFSAGDYSSILCLVTNRIAFYLGSYRSSTFIFSNIKNRLFFQSVQDVGQEEHRYPGFSLWIRSNLDWQQNVAPDPLGWMGENMGAEKMTVQSEMAASATYVQQSVPLAGNKHYTFSVWVWSDQAEDMQISLSQQGWEDAPLAFSNIAINTKPQRFSVTGKTDRFGHYTVRIGSPQQSVGPVFGSSVSDSFYAWGAQLEEGKAMTDYAGIENLAAAGDRTLSPKLLIINLAALIMALLFLFQTRKLFLFQPVGITAVVVVAASLAEALIIIPEQRFAVVFMVTIWVLAIGQCLLWLSPQDSAPA